MMVEMASLTIEEEPGAHVQVLYRDRGDDPPPPVFTGRLGPDGRVTVSVPRGYFVVLSPGCETGIVHLETGLAAQTLRFSSVRT